MTALRDAALHYATVLGWSVIPLHSIDDSGACTCGRPACNAAGKHPRIEHGVSDATSAPDQIEDWWQRWPDANIGVATNHGLVAVDIDPARGGIEGHADAVRRLGDLGPTLTARTGSGGIHHYYQSGSANVRNSANRIAPGVDVRGAGGYFVAPPSVHRSGGVYQWLHGGPGVDPIVHLTPEWLAAMLPQHRDPRPTGGSAATSEASRRQAERYLRERAPVAIQGQGGSDATMVVMATLRTMGVASADDAIDVISRSGWNDRCQPPWEIEGTQGLRRKYDQSTAPIGEPPRAPAQHDRGRGQAPTLSASDVISEARSGGGGGGAPRARSADAADPLDFDREMEIDKNGRPKTTYRNAVIWVRWHRELGEHLAVNTMSLQTELGGTTITDAQISRLRELVEAETRMVPTRDMLCDAIYRVASARSYHPIRRYLDGIQWDGKPRIDRLLTDVLRVTDTPISRAFLRCFFVGSVARAMAPGCKHDTVLVLVGPEGTKKSTFFEILGGDWFSDSAVDLAKNDAYLQIHSAWIYEWSELNELTSRTHAARVRSFLSSRSDTFRAPYGRSVEAHRRTTVIVGTANPTTILADPEGDRRFHVIAVPGRIDTEVLREWRDQLWAEAVDRYARHRADENDPTYRYWLSDSEECERNTAASAHRSQDTWYASIESWVSGRAVEITTRDIATGAIGLSEDRITPACAHRIAGVMRQLGYDCVQRRTGNSRARVWSKG